MTDEPAARSADKEPVSMQDSPRSSAKSERPWLCLTSLWHRRFVEDVIHVIGLPRGARLRLRYRREHVEVARWADAEHQRISRDTAIVIALVGNPKGESLCIVPLRRAKLESATCYGSLMVLDVSLGSFLTPGPQSDTSWCKVALSNIHPPPAEQAGSAVAGAFVQQLHEIPPGCAQDDSALAWEDVASRVFALDDTTSQPNDVPRVPFLFRVSGLSKGLQRSLSRHGALRCEGGASFSIDIHTITRAGVGKISTPLGEVVVDISHPSTKPVTSRRIRIDSKRDVKRIKFVTSATFRRTLGHLSVRAVYFKYGSSEQFEWSSVNERTLIDDVPAKQTAWPGRNDTAPKQDRHEMVAARYDFPLVVGLTLPWLACTMVALAAAITVYRGVNNDTSAYGQLILPTAVFVLTFLGLFIGLKGNKS